MITNRHTSTRQRVTFPTFTLCLWSPFTKQHSQTCINKATFMNLFTKFRLRTLFTKFRLWTCSPSFVHESDHKVSFMNLFTKFRSWICSQSCVHQVGFCNTDKYLYLLLVIWYDHHHYNNTYFENNRKSD